MARAKPDAPYEDMEVANLYLEPDEYEKMFDDVAVQAQACFNHKDAPEQIFYIGASEAIAKLLTLFPTRVITAMQDAALDGFKYCCIYSG